MSLKLSVIKTICEPEIVDSLDFLERKILTGLDIEISNKNPDVIFRVICEKYRFKFEFQNGIIEVKQEFRERDKFFQKLESFRQSIRYLECDFHATDFLEKYKDIF
ncbi:MAG TPA: hypothetical protein EYG60_05895 [Campylobacterales bacterium]|nr:hypothetical protein [Campylobacterales bacterium]